MGQRSVAGSKCLLLYSNQRFLDQLEFLRMTKRTADVYGERKVVSLMLDALIHYLLLVERRQELVPKPVFMSDMTI